MPTSLDFAKYVGNMFRRKLTFMHGVTEIYKPSIARNKEKLLELVKDKAERASKSELVKKMKVLKGFYTLEIAPPDAIEMQKLNEDIKLAKDFFKTGAIMHLTVKQAWLLFLVGLEVILWFFIGETIGKFHLVGYKV